MFKKKKSEEGAITFVFMLGVVGVSFVIFSTLTQRSQNEFNLASHRDIQSDKEQVLKAFQNIADCPANPPPCAANDHLEIKDKTGKMMVARDGMSRIGRWNVRIDCMSGSKDKPADYGVMIGRFSPSGEVLNDPLTKKPMSFKKMSSLIEACSLGKSDDTKLLSNICYGAINGKEKLPSGEAKDCGECQFKNTYCGDNQVPFPTCPEGYIPTFRYSDRYGWGGIDLTKYTLCRKKTI